MALLELPEEMDLVTELSEEFALELFYDTFRTILEPARLAVLLKGLNWPHLYMYVYQPNSRANKKHHLKQLNVRLKLNIENKGEKLREVKRISENESGKEVDLR